MKFNCKIITLFLVAVIFLPPAHLFAQGRPGGGGPSGGGAPGGMGGPSARPSGGHSGTGSRVRQRQNRQQQGQAREQRSHPNANTGPPLPRRFERSHKYLTKHRLEYVRLKDTEKLARSGEIIATNITASNLRMAKRFGFTFKRETKLPLMGITLTVLTPPQKLNLTQSLALIRKFDKRGHYEANAVFEASSSKISSTNTDPKNIGLNIQPPEKTQTSFTVGVIDTGANANHPSLKTTTISQQNFGRGKATTPRDHGTAVSALISAHGQANILLADVFSGEAMFGDAESIVQGLNWLAVQNVKTINMSLNGPDSPLLKLAIEHLINTGFTIVAAVGNQGPDGPLPFPASYTDVIGVTAINNKGAIYKKAGQGPFVDIAAIGVNIKAAQMKGNSRVSGTSYATPFVSAFLATHHSEGENLNPMELLTKNSKDMGESGRDPIYGLGVLTP